MTGSGATFEVSLIFELAVVSAIVLRGHVKSGAVAPGMLAEVGVDGGVFMPTPIKSVEYIGGLATEATVDQMLEASDNDVRELWLGLCQAGDVLSIEAPKQSK